MTSVRRPNSECTQAIVYLFPRVTANEFDTVRLEHRCFVKCELLGHFDDSMEHWHDPVIQDIEVPRTQPEALQSDARTEIDERPILRQGFEQRTLVPVEG